MRESRRDHILNSAVAVVERDGVRGLTLDAVAAQAAVTKPGLLYHFPSREALLAAVHEHVATGWETEMAAHAGGGPEEVDTRARQEAYLALCARSGTRAELLLVLESITDGPAGAPWNRAVQHWTPDPAEDADDAAVDAFVARMAADGLWMHEASAAAPLPPALRARVLDRLRRVGGANAPDDSG